MVWLVADHDFAGSPECDVLMVLGGPGWEAACSDSETLAFIKRAPHGSQTVAAVCTGGMILAAAGLLNGHIATTKHEIFAGESSPLDLMADHYDVVQTVIARIVESDNVITGGGVTLGIDMTLHLLQRFCGNAVAQETARVMEYAAAWQANAVRLPDYVGSSTSSVHTHKLAKDTN